MGTDWEQLRVHEWDKGNRLEVLELRRLTTACREYILAGYASREESWRQKVSERWIEADRAIEKAERLLELGYFIQPQGEFSARPNFYRQAYQLHNDILFRYEEARREAMDEARKAVGSLFEDVLWMLPQPPPPMPAASEPGGLAVD